MKKELLLSCVFATLASPALMAEQFEGNTQLVQDAAVQYTVIPGYYTELSGTFNFNLQEVYNAIYNQVGLLVNRQYWIIDSNNEIVYDGKGNMSPVGTGMRNQNNFNCEIPTENKITEEGVYYFVLATDTPHTDNNNAQLYTTGETLHIDNLMFGPYHVVSQLNDPVEAKISVSPAGEIDASYFDVEEGASHNSLITLTVEDVSVMGCGAIDNNFKVTDPKGANVSMDLLSIDGGTLSMEFPTGYEPVPGKYTITVDFSEFSGFTANAEPIVFPDTPQTYTFTVSGVAFEELTSNMISFIPGVYSGLPKVTFLTVVPTPYRPTSTSDFPLADVVKPSGAVESLSIKQTSLSRGVQYAIPEGFFDDYGTYIITIDFKGCEGIGNATDTKGQTCLMGKLTLEYTFNELPVEATVTGATVVDGNVELVSGETATVELSSTPGVSVYYILNDGAPALYASPLEISGEATLSYYAQNLNVDGKNKVDCWSKTQTLNFHVAEKVITDLTYRNISLKPGEYAGLPDVSSLNIETVPFRPEVLDSYPLALVEKPDGDVVELAIERSSFSRGVSYTVPQDLFDQYGTYSVTLDFKGCKGLGNITETAGTTGYMGVLKLEYTFVDPTPAAPEASVSGATLNDEGIYLIPKNESATVTIECEEGASVYYVWNEGEESLYSNPIELSEDGTLSYFAAKDEYRSEVQTIEFKVDVITGINGISGEDTDDVEYYTVDGLRVSNPAPGAVTIRRSGGKSSIIILPKN